MFARKFPHSLCGVTHFGSELVEEVDFRRLPLQLLSTLCFRLSSDNFGTFRTSKSDTTLDLTVVTSPSESLESDEDEPKHSADVDASFIFRNGAFKYLQVVLCACVPLTVVTGLRNGHY